MFWKDALAKKVLHMADTNQLNSPRALFAIQKDFLSLRVKTIDVQGKVPVIRISETSEWMKPKEWALNHISNLRRQHRELHSRLCNLGCDPIEEMGFESLGWEFDNSGDDDLST